MDFECTLGKEHVFVQSAGGSHFCERCLAQLSAFTWAGESVLALSDARIRSLLKWLKRSSAYSDAVVCCWEPVFEYLLKQRTMGHADDTKCKTCGAVRCGLAYGFATGMCDECTLRIEGGPGIRARFVDTTLPAKTSEPIVTVDLSDWWD